MTRIPLLLPPPGLNKYAEIEEEDRQMLKDIEADCKRRCNLKVHVDLLGIRRVDPS